MTHLQVCSRRGLFCLLTIILAGFSFGCGRTASAPEEPPVAPVKVAAAEKASLAEWTELVGTTQPLPGRAARITAAVEGRVLWVLGNGQGKAVAEGQHVEAGQIVVQLDDRVAQANREKVRAGQDELIEQKKQADIAVSLAKIEVDRLEELKREEMKRAGTAGAGLPLVTRVDLPKAHLALDDAESKQRGITAKQASGKAELKALDEQLGLYTLRAPIAGRLGLIQATPGQTLTVGSLVADVVDLGEIDVLCFAPPAVASRLALGQAARLSAANGHTEERPGKVVFIAVQAQSETGNFAIKVRFPNRDGGLWANLVARLQVQTKPAAERLTIPDSAVMEDQDPPGVVVVEKIEKKENKEHKEETFGKARRLRAIVGVRDREHQKVEILRLEDPKDKKPVPIEGVQFVVEGGNGLHDDDAVKIEEEEHKDKEEK